jgi:hypothetical protein
LQSCGVFRKIRYHTQSKAKNNSKNRCKINDIANTVQNLLRPPRIVQFNHFPIENDKSKDGVKSIGCAAENEHITKAAALDDTNIHAGLVPFLEIGVTFFQCCVEDKVVQYLT